MGINEYKKIDYFIQNLSFIYRQYYIWQELQKHKKQLPARLQKVLLTSLARGFLLGDELDCIAARLEKEDKNKKILLKKVEIFNSSQAKDYYGKSITELDYKEREKERQIFSLFAELKTADELRKKGLEISFL